MKSRYPRWLIALVVILIVVAVAVSIALHFATKALQHQVEEALGENSEVGEIVVGWSSIEIRRIRIHAPQGWPAADTLRAERVVITPDLKGLIQKKINISRIVADDAYLSTLRTRDGHLRLLPSLLEKPASARKPSSLAVNIGDVELHGGTVEFFDASIGKPAHKLRLEQIHADVGDVQLPALSGHSKISVEGVLKGVQRDGSLSIQGWANLGNKDSELATQLQNVDLVVLQPYLIKAAETGVRRGTLDMQLKSAVHNNELHAAGTVTLTGLELVTDGGAGATFMGVPRRAIISALENQDNRITVPFSLDGNLDDPRFSLNDSFAMRIGTSIAGKLGVDIAGLTHHVGNAAAGLGDAVKHLFGK